jgi:hypothetical protein
MDDVLAHLVISARYPHFGAADPVIAVGVKRCQRGHVSQRGPGLRLGQAHGREETALGQRPNVAIDLIGGTVRQNQVGARAGQQRIARGGYIRSLHPREASAVNHLRQLDSTQGVVHGCRRKTGRGECPERGLHLRKKANASAFHTRRFTVGARIVIREVAFGDLVRHVEELIEAVPRGKHSRQ